MATNSLLDSMFSSGWQRSGGNSLLGIFGSLFGGLGGLGGGGSNSPASTPTPTGPVKTEQEKALEAFYNTPLYQFPLEQGLEAVNANYAARGMLQSGAAQKAIEEYGNNMAAQGLRDYMAALGNQQSLGATAASSQAGIGANYGNSLSNLSGNYSNALTGLNQGYANNLTNLYGNMANAQSQYATNVGNINSNAAIANANNTNSMIGGINNALGNAAGYFAYQPYSAGGPINLLSGTPYE